MKQHDRDLPRALVAVHNQAIADLDALARRYPRTFAVAGTVLLLSPVAFLLAAAGAPALSWLFLATGCAGAIARAVTW